MHYKATIKILLPPSKKVNELLSLGLIIANLSLCKRKKTWPLTSSDARRKSLYKTYNKATQWASYRDC